MSLKSDIARDSKKVNRRMGKAEAYKNQIIKEQEQLIKVSEGRISKINSNLKALRFRLKDYATETPKPLDANYYELKNQYKNYLRDRAILERSISIAQESISAAKLNYIPGQGYQKGEQL